MKYCVLIVILFCSIAFAQIPTGSIDVSGCPAGSSCFTFTISCPGTEDITGAYNLEQTLFPLVGTAVFFSGGQGQSYYLNTSIMTEFKINLLASGYNIVQVKWLSSGWFESPYDSGLVSLACRPATIINHLHDTIPHANKFVLVGHSGGSGQIAYALSHYGLGSIVDVLIPMGGPPMSDLQNGCNANSSLKLPNGGRLEMDQAFGFSNSDGPCYLFDSSWSDRFYNESIATSGNDYFHPNTRIHFLIGSLDLKMQTVGAVYRDRLIQAGQSLTFEIVPNTSHNIRETPEGRVALLNAILSE